MKFDIRNCELVCSYSRGQPLIRVKNDRLFFENVAIIDIYEYRRMKSIVEDYEKGYIG